MRLLSLLVMTAISTSGQAADFEQYNSGIPAAEGNTFTVPGNEGGPNVLWYTDGPTDSHHGMRLALEALGYGYTTANTPAIYEGLLQTEDWDLVMQGHYNFLDTEFDDEVAAYIAGGGRAVIHDWRTERTYDGVTISYPTNYPSMTPIAGSRFHELFGSRDAITLGPWGIGWGVFAETLVGGAGEAQLTSSPGGIAGRIGDGGNTFIHGFIDDTIGPGFFDPALATDIFAAMILTVPEPGTLGMLGMGCVGLLWRRR